MTTTTRMFHAILLILLPSLGFPAPLPAEAATVLYVKPTESTPCPGEPCHTLDEYVQNGSQYFVSDTTVEFLQGTHNLSQPLNISGVNNLSLVARNVARNETIIWLSEHLRFTNVSNLTFVDCDFSQSNTSIVVNTSHSVTFSDCDFPDSGKYWYSTNPLVYLVTSHNVTFTDCKFSEGNVLQVVSMVTSHNVTFIDCDFSGNTVGSVVKLVDTSHVTFSDCNFSENKAQTVVGLQHSYNVTFTDCTFTDSSQNMYTLGILYLYYSHNMTFINCNFSGNKNMHGIVTLYYSHNGTFINCSINKNKATSIDIYRPYVAYGIMVIDLSYNVIFANCSFYANIGTSIWSYNSNFTLSGTILFSDNTAYEGGALAFYGESVVYISNNTNVTFINNTAENVGGAIFVRNPLPYVTHSCFLQFLAINTSPQCSGCNCALPQFNINFISNTAKEGGNTIFGAYLYGCSLDGARHCSSLVPLIQNSSHLNFEPSLKSDLSVISSDPTRVCLCKNGKPNCTLIFNNRSNYRYYPGEEFSISAAVVGDMFGTVAGSVYAQILPFSNATLGDLQHSQQTNSHDCAELKYSLLSEPGLIEMAFTANKIPVQSYSSDSTILNEPFFMYNEYGHFNYENLTTPVYINITLLPCPLGFMFSGPPHTQCICHSLLHGYEITCNITDQTIRRRDNVWVSSEENGTRLMVSKHCPYGYCKAQDVNVRLDHPDTQCTFNHSGRLCGGCHSGLSLALGSPQCLDCSNNYHLALLIPFALAGLALVFFIKVLNLTVAKGTINGLIFYANIIQSNQAVFFPTEPVIGLYPIKVFIAWLNLDLGITTCFFDGLDGYWKTWLQFMFPLYLWAIITLIICLSHKFQSVANFFGNNSVPVLATLIFLSYAKLLRTVITAVSFSFLEVSDNSRVAVWSFDGNTEYLSGKHIPLFVVALVVLLFLWLPYTVLLLFEQCIQKISNYWIRKWMLRLKPFLDAYFGPFRGEHRYWVGVLLVARAVLLLVFGLNSTNDPSVNLLAITTVAVLLLIHLPYDTHKIVYLNGAGKHIRFWGGSYYHKWYLSLLENSFILNLLMLATGSLYVLAAEGDQTVVVYTSVSITFCQFIVIIIFHGYNQFTKMLRSQWKQIRELQSIDRADYEPIPDQPVGLGKDQWPPYQPMNQCREPLLEDEDD